MASLPNVVDLKYAKVGGDGTNHIDDLELKYVQGLGATSDQINDAWMEVFIIFGPSTALTGTVTVGIGAKAVVGVGTLFTTELVVGDAIVIAGEAHFVADITDNLNLTLARPHVAGATAVGFKLVTDRQWNDAAYAYLGGLGHSSDSLNGRWATFWAGVLP